MSTRVLLKTSMGDVTLELDEAHAPISVANFLSYVDEGFYDGTVFHRVIPDFMIQGGGFEPGMRQKQTRANIKNEPSNGLENKRGTVAMARTPAPDSASSQFFINLKDNSFLDRARSGDGVGYCVFGKVVEGMDVVDQIKAVKTTRAGGHADVPASDVTIVSAKRVD